MILFPSLTGPRRPPSPPCLFSANAASPSVAIVAACCRAALAWAAATPPPVEAGLPQRSPDAFARHLGLYLAHVACGLGVREVARVSACHPSSVAYAIARIEEAREDLTFDGAAEQLEAQARRLAGDERP